MLFTFKRFVLIHHEYVFVYSTFSLGILFKNALLHKNFINTAPRVNFWDNSMLHRKRVSVPNIVSHNEKASKTSVSSRLFWTSVKRIESSRSSEGNFIYYETQFRSGCVTPNDQHPDFIVAASSTRSTVGDFLFMLVRQRDKLLIMLDE
uniref:Uncharacterized protein n=1 Tax=Echinococcus granulosus TaxID=6210 RepID=A0A068WM10_ECHGR|nr:hypothetical protein EgrG_000651300 [Echinococcus granulosus]